MIKTDCAKKIFYIFLLYICSFLLFSCSKKQEEQNQITTENKNHKWYYFNNDTFLETQKLQDIPLSIKKPWTEAVRISSANVEADFNEDVPKGYALVNRQGLLVFDDKEIFYYKDNAIFNNSTAFNLIFIENTPVFSTYKNTFFNTNINNNLKETPVLVQFNNNEKIFYPILYNKDITEKGIITDIIYNGSVWTCSIKSVIDGLITFDYINFQNKVPLLSITPYNAKEKLFITDTTVDNYRNIKKQSDFSFAPERIKNILEKVSKTIPFELKCYTVGSHSPRIFINNTNKNLLPLQATAIIAESWTGILFQDGTFYLQGTLHNKNLINKAKPIALKLPKLPTGYNYGEFVITGNSLYASWEESSFFNTERSGFIFIDLNSLVYNL